MVQYGLILTSVLDPDRIAAIAHLMIHWLMDPP